MSFEKDMKKHIICHIKNVIYVAHIYHGKDRPDGNKQKPVERETRQLIQTYNVLLKSQIYAYFAKTQRDHFVGRTFKTLEKENRFIFIRIWKWQQ